MPCYGEYTLIFRFSRFFLRCLPFCLTLLFQLPNTEASHAPVLGTYPSLLLTWASQSCNRSWLIYSRDSTCWAELQRYNTYSHPFLPFLQPLLSLPNQPINHPQTPPFSRLAKSYWLLVTLTRRRNQVRALWLGRAGACAAQLSLWLALWRLPPLCSPKRFTQGGGSDGQFSGSVPQVMNLSGPLCSH